MQPSHCFQMGPCATNQSLCLWNCPSLNVALFPLFGPTRLVKFRVWLRRKGPTCCPYYTTLSGWRLWDGMPFTKNSSLKTSIRSLMYFNWLHITHKPTICVYMTACFLCIFFRHLVSCPEWLYRQRRWTITLSGLTSIIRYKRPIITHPKEILTQPLYLILYLVLLSCFTLRHLSERNWTTDGWALHFG